MTSGRLPLASWRRRSHTPGRLLGALLALGGCSLDLDAGDSVGLPAEPPAYPAEATAIRVGEVLPDLAFEGVSGEGERATLRLGDFYRPAGDEPRLLVIQVSGGLWCGTCLWTASHFDEVLGAPLSRRVDRLELIVRDRDNGPASAEEDAEAWRVRVGGLAVPVAVDPDFVLGAALDGVAAPLPLVLVIDEGSMTLLDVRSDPTPGELRAAVAGALAELEGFEAPEHQDEPLVDGLFDRKEWAMFVEMAQLPGAPPDDPTNEVADSVAAQLLGEALFFDAGLSPSGDVSCATCHDPAAALSDGRPRAIGAEVGDRRTPSIALASHARWQNWDGSADSLWAQALGPLENPLEHGSSRAFVARRVLERHGALYEAAFPGEPAHEPARWPASGKPGDAVYDALAAGQREAITRVFVHVGKAIAAYERTFRVAPTRFDAYVNGEPTALTPDEKLGMKAFATSGCLQCHFGPRLTNDAFHNTRTRSGRADGEPDLGRRRGVLVWRQSEFRADGRWSAAPELALQASDDPVSLGQFKTPSLRGVAEQAFFNHGGSAASLAAVTEAYGTGGVAPGDPSCAGEREPWLKELSETAQWALVPFLQTLTVAPQAP